MRPCEDGSSWCMTVGHTP